MKTIKVKITKSNFDSYWYADKIGQVFEVENVARALGYKVTNSSNGECIGVDDCVVVYEPKFDIDEAIAGESVHNDVAGGISNGKFIGYLFEFPICRGDPIYIGTNKDGLPVQMFNRGIEPGDFSLSMQPKKQKVKKYQFLYKKNAHGIFQVTDDWYKNGTVAFGKMPSLPSFWKRIDESMIEVEE